MLIPPHAMAHRHRLCPAAQAHRKQVLLQSICCSSSSCGLTVGNCERCVKRIPELHHRLCNVVHNCQQSLQSHDEGCWLWSGDMSDPLQQSLQLLANMHVFALVHMTVRTDTDLLSMPWAAGCQEEPDAGALQCMTVTTLCLQPTSQYRTAVSQSRDMLSDIDRQQRMPC